MNATGIQQAEECGEFLKTLHWDVVITSPLKRAKQTAEIINKRLQIPLIEMGEFVEKSFGDAEGMTVEERMKAFPNNAYPNQEDNKLLKIRVMKGIHKINEKYRNKKVLLVAHGAVINSILGTLSKGEIGSGKTKLINACISNIQFFEEQWSVNNFNQISHLSGV
uniref:Phosphatase PhoE n=1 Tax=Virgibacillus oceani TaxID=1479511 RepID=A0A917HPR0_9BACI|nr:putative phosphatase PhoE [Virgibacillus oceani]